MSTFNARYWLVFRDGQSRSVCARNNPETIPLERNAAFIRVNITLRRCESYTRQQLKVYLDHHRRIAYLGDECRLV
jgi:hypothetical protein